MLLPTMDANPQLYDYIHALAFGADGRVELLAGAGQLFNAVARGRYETRELGPLLIEVDPATTLDAGVACLDARQLGIFWVEDED